MRRGFEIWSLVPWDSIPRMTAMTRASSNCKLQTHLLVRENIIKDYDRRCSFENKILTMGLKGLRAKKN
jgi:hypothetical protein